MGNSFVGVWKYILAPSVITLAVTVIRLIGELQHWNEVFFRRSAGGAGAVIGIVWLAFVFAIYFAVRLQNSGDIFTNRGKAIGLTLLALLLFVGGQALIFSGVQSGSTAKPIAGALVTVAGVLVMRNGWPSYWKVMLAYALAARIPVLIVMYLAFRGNWNTHYDATVPNLAGAAVMTKFLQLGVVPQLFFWVPLTVVFCGLFGIITVALRRRSSTGTATQTV